MSTSHLPLGFMGRDAAITVLEPFLDKIESCIRTGWRDWEQLKNSNELLSRCCSPRTRANLVSDFIGQAARQVFDQCPEVQIVDQKGLLLIVIYDQIVIRFKKLDEELQPSNIATHQQETIMAQLPLTGLPSVTYLVAGYQLNPLQTEIEETSIVCLYEKRVVWYDTFGDTEQGAEQMQLPLPSGPIAPPRIRPKNIPPTPRVGEAKQQEG